MTNAFNLSQLANNVNSSGKLNAAAGLYNQVPVANGGTGQSSFTANAAIISDAAGTTLTAVAAGAVGNVLTSNGTTWISGAGSGVVPVLNVYTTPGVWNKPASIKGIKVTVVGGGGNGGTAVGRASSPTVPYLIGVGGGGGGGGGSIRVYPAPSIPGPQPYTVGSATQTSSFGVTSVPAPFTVISATAGSNGGSGSSLAPASANGGIGGSGSGGQLNVYGGGGGSAAGSTSSYLAGAGGSSMFGGGAQGVAGSSAGQSGQVYGGGGGGGVVPNAGGTNPGGTGAAGVVMVEEFY